MYWFVLPFLFLITSVCLMFSAFSHFELLKGKMIHWSKVSLVNQIRDLVDSNIQCPFFLLKSIGYFHWKHLQAISFNGTTLTGSHLISLEAVFNVYEKDTPDNYQKNNLFNCLSLFSSTEFMLKYSPFLTALSSIHKFLSHGQTEHVGRGAYKIITISCDVHNMKDIINNGDL